jgi:hypothetical protein
MAISFRMLERSLLRTAQRLSQSLRDGTDSLYMAMTTWGLGHDTGIPSAGVVTTGSLSGRPGWQNRNGYHNSA